MAVLEAPARQVVRYITLRQTDSRRYSPSLTSILRSQEPITSRQGDRVAQDRARDGVAWTQASSRTWGFDGLRLHTDLDSND